MGSMTHENNLKTVQEKYDLFNTYLFYWWESKVGKGVGIGWDNKNTGWTKCTYSAQFSDRQQAFAICVCCPWCWEKVWICFGSK